MRKFVLGLIAGGVLTFIVSVALFFQTEDPTLMLFGFMGLVVAFCAASVAGVRWSVERFGKRRTSIVAAAIGALLLALSVPLFFLTEDPMVLSFAIMLVSAFAAVAVATIVASSNADPPAAERREG